MSAGTMRSTRPSVRSRESAPISPPATCSSPAARATPGRRSLGSRPQRRGAPCRGRERPRSRCAAAGRARIGCACAGHQGMSRHEAGRALICGSLAFDTIMVFGDRFANHILPDKIHMLNVSFLVPQLRREYGGCAGNIAYNLSLLGDVGYPMATVGRDFAPYKEWMARTGVPADHVRVIEDELTAQAFITTDLDDNQITAFHPGAMHPAP